ncbi:Avirulence (Avh) protein, partial [Phytophthora megakarya]
MRLILVVCVVTTILITCIFAVATANSTPPVLPVDVSKTSSKTEPWRATHPTATNGINNKRFLRREEETNQNIKVTGSMNDTSNIDSTLGPSEEERGVKVVPLEMLGKQEAVSKLVKKKTITTAVTNLLRRNKKQKILRKFRVKILESLPPEQAADLIFLKMPKKEIPPKLPS